VLGTSCCWGVLPSRSESESWRVEVEPCLGERGYGGEQCVRGDEQFGSEAAGAGLEELYVEEVMRWSPSTKQGSSQ